MMRVGPNGNRRDPLVSPIYGDLRGLPPMYIQVGANELLVDDSHLLVNAAEKAAVGATEAWSSVSSQS